ncbi:mitochondrial 39-S ribosomal protein L47 (MRP-L47)-domain-containing protein [Trichophaea hybrida]|nr:mitochondrial 39-S ribosomal protein L47 (MRP-L47)-domain-containing protein [Trichophaea hybrida]
MSLSRPTLRLLFPRNTSSSGFHTSAATQFPRRITRDRNPNRGVSAVRRQPHKEPLGVEKYGLPQPVVDPARHTQVETDPDHGLWGFFHDKKALPTPEEDDKHGRAWSVEELRQKSWEDLHRLWWVCVRERNIMATQKMERKRLKPGYGDYEAGERDKTVRRTQRAIKHVLTERFYAWEEASNLAVKDPEIDLSGNGPLYTPMAVLEEPAEAAEAAEAAETTETQPAKSA